MPNPTRPIPHPSAEGRVTTFHREAVEQVAEAVSTHDVVVVGMGWNPHVKRARKALEAGGFSPTYLEFGNYISQWHPRLALKMWSGWPTFPMVFVKGGLLGGADETQAAIDDGTVKVLLEG